MGVFLKAALVVGWSETYVKCMRRIVRDFVLGFEAKEENVEANGIYFNSPRSITCMATRQI